jgi:hypothetical protein
MAGSKPGERRGGRQKGTPNKQTVASRKKAATDIALVAEMVRNGIDLSSTPMAVDVMRMAMTAHLKLGFIDKAAAWAKELAPYESPKLSSVEHAGKPGSPLSVEVAIIRERIAGKLARLTAGNGTGGDPI